MPRRRPARLTGLAEALKGIKERLFRRSGSICAWKSSIIWKASRRRTGLAKGLFSEQRYKDDGSENPDFVLNKPAYRKSRILVAGDNFGCGSSREHAPWALMDFGIRCVISTSFGDIFYNNCFKNGVLPIRVSPEDLEKLFDDAERGANSTLSIDLEKQEIKGPDGGTVKFEIDAHRKHCMLNGLDDIGLTKLKADKIVSYEAKAEAARPWA
ncbi:MAG: 3-isopropylmalate dehydratase small subunit [Hyphomicrobiales bacterium]|nr:3-isopropylmalate dehydratase small subunit [Hyphomicrobiales bacterium]